MSTPTTRRYPRSLADAFPDERAAAIEHCRTARPWRWSTRVIAALLAAAILAVSLGWI